MVAFAIVMMSLLLLFAPSNYTGADSCSFEREFTNHEGNMSCPHSAPVLSFLSTSVTNDSQINQNQTTPPANWTMRCECPDWSMHTDIDETSQWRPFTEELETISLQCDLNQFISGLAFQLLDGFSWYQWSGRCSNHSSSYTTSEWNCWEESFTIQDGVGRNNIMSTPHSTVFIKEVQVAYDHSNVNSTAREWSYKLCHIRLGECSNPVISHGRTELDSAPARLPPDIVYAEAAVKSAEYNTTLTLFCDSGFYLDGPSSTFCQANGEWTELPSCKACKLIKHCQRLHCTDGDKSQCLKCRPYSSIGLKVVLTNSKRRCRTVPYIRRAELDALYVFGAGECVQMECFSYGSPRPTVEWIRYGQNLSVFDLIEPGRLQTFENGSLKIHNLTSKDEGVYACRAVNAVGSDVIYVTLVYNESGLSEFIPSAPRILNETSTVLFFPRNNHAILDCSASGNPPPRVRWSRRDPHRQYYLPLYGDLRIAQLDNGSLGFFPITREDWGVYACEAVNYFGVDVATWIVCVGNICGEEPIAGEVTPPPPQLIDHSPLIVKWTQVYFVGKGDSLSLTCVAWGNPHPLLSWHHGMTSISEGEILTIKNATFSDIGIYECRAVNRVGQDKRKMAVIVHSQRHRADLITTTGAPNTNETFEVNATEVNATETFEVNATVTFEVDTTETFEVNATVTLNFGVKISTSASMSLYPNFRTSKLLPSSILILFSAFSMSLWHLMSHPLFFH